MAYKINRDDEFIVEPDGLASVKDVGRFRRELMQKTPEFYELEPAEVIKIHIDETDENFPYIDDKPDWSRYGMIEARMIYSSLDDNTIQARPLDTNIKQYPLPGELVIVVNYLGDLYYSQKLNILNSVNINAHPGISKNSLDPDDYTEYDFQSTDWIRPIKSNAGDITFNGRFGQSVRFGSNVKEISDDDTTRKKDSPNVIIRAGQGYTYPDEQHKPVTEDINLDGSSLWMTTDQRVDINLDNTHSTFIGPEKGPDGFGGNRITINSDGLIFNSKKNNILMSSMGFIGISANTEIGIEVPNDTGKVYLGDGLGYHEPALGGDTTMEILEKLITALENFATTIQGAKGTVVDFVVPLSDIIEGANGLKGSLGVLKGRLNEPKSKTVHVGHLSG